MLPDDGQVSISYLQLAVLLLCTLLVTAGLAVAATVGFAAQSNGFSIYVSTPYADEGIGADKTFAGIPRDESSDQLVRGVSRQIPR